MLKYIDNENASDDELVETFCRDIDAFNAAFVVTVCYLWNIPYPMTLTR